MTGSHRLGRPGRHRLPGFQMYDLYVTGEMTVRALVSAPRCSLSRAEIVHRLRYVARFDKGIESAYVTFTLDASGKVERVAMKPVSPTADFSFDYQDLMLPPIT